MTMRKDLGARAKLIEELAKQDGSEEMQGAAEAAREYLKEFDNAQAQNNTQNAERAAQDIVRLSGIISELAKIRKPSQPQSKLQKFWPVIGMVLLGLVFFGLAVFVGVYIWRSGIGVLSTIDGTRPLLVIAAILSTITFGGALIVAPLFSSEGTFDERFRRAREIFLVFSGVFGTVIGFYFGANDSQEARLHVSAMLEDDTVVTYASGGVPPYSINLTYGPGKKTKAAKTGNGWSSFQLDKETDNILPLTISATDSSGLHGEQALILDGNELKDLGWKLPKTPQPPASQERPLVPEQPPAPQELPEDGQAPAGEQPAEPETPSEPEQAPSGQQLPQPEEPQEGGQPPQTG